MTINPLLKLQLITYLKMRRTRSSQGKTPAKQPTKKKTPKKVVAKKPAKKASPKPKAVAKEPVR